MSANFQLRYLPLLKVIYSVIVVIFILYNFDVLRIFTSEYDVILCTTLKYNFFNIIQKINYFCRSTIIKYHQYIKELLCYFFVADLGLTGIFSFHFITSNGTNIYFC